MTERPAYSILIRGIENEVLAGLPAVRHGRRPVGVPLATADVELSADVLDRIDEVVPPGVTLNPADNGWVSPSLEASARRRC